MIYSFYDYFPSALCSLLWFILGYGVVPHEILLHQFEAASQPKRSVSLVRVDQEAWVALGTVLPFYSGFFVLQFIKLLKVRVELQEEEK